MTSTLGQLFTDLLPERVVRSHDVTVGVRANDSAILERLMDLLPPGWSNQHGATPDIRYTALKTSAGPGQLVRYELVEDDRLLGAWMRRQPLWHAFESAVRLEVGSRSPTRVFVHAGVVGWGSQAILLPGPSGTGKSTLVLELVRAGATYYSDEYAVLDERGLVHPYARPISCRQGEHRRLRVNTERDLGSTPATAPARVALIVHGSYREQAVWSPKAVASGASAIKLMSNALGARVNPALVFSVLSAVVFRAPSIESDRGEASQAAAELISYLQPLLDHKEPDFHEAARPH